MGAFTVIAFVQPWSIRGDLSFLLRAMTLLLYLLISRKTSAADCLRKYMWLCVGCTYFSYVCVWLLCIRRLLRKFVYGFCKLSDFCVRKWIFVRIKRLFRTYTAFCTLWANFWVRIRIFGTFNVLVIQSWGFVDLFEVPMIRSWQFIDSFDVPMIQSWGFVDSFKVLMIRSWMFVYSLKARANARDYWTAWSIRLEDPIFRVLFLKICTFWLDHLENPLFRVPSSYLYDVVIAIHRPILPDQVLIQRSSRDSLSDLTLDCFLLILWSNI